MSRLDEIKERLELAGGMGWATQIKELHRLRLRMDSTVVVELYGFQLLPEVYALVCAPEDIAYLHDLVVRMRDLLSSTADDEPCRYDCADFCQVHCRPHPCAHGEATDLLKELDR